MVRSIQDVKKSQFDESQGGLMPTRIESDEARITDELKGAHGAARRLKAKDDDNALAETAEPGMYGKARLVRVNRVVEQNIEHGLVPEDLGIAWQARAGDMRERFIVGHEGPIRFQRHAGFHHSRIREADIAFVNLNLFSDPKSCRLMQRRIDSIEIQVARALFWKLDIAHGLERHADN